MTSKHIKQNAEAYLKKLLVKVLRKGSDFTSGKINRDIVIDAYIAGARSRNEEIKDLREMFEAAKYDIEQLEWHNPKELPEVGKCFSIVRRYNGYNRACFGFFKGKDAEGYWFCNDLHEFVVKEEDFLAWREEQTTIYIPEYTPKENA